MKTRNLKTKTLSILLAIVMLLSLLPMSVFAAETEDYITVFDELVYAGQYFEGGSGAVDSVAPADNYLHYEGDGKITLKNFVHSDASVSHAILTDNKDVSLTLIGESELTNYNGCSFVVVNYGKLQISGDGSLKSNGGISCGDFAFSGGTVTVDGVTSEGDIIISGGELTLTSWSLKAIGNYDISITGGKVTASGNRYAIFATGDNGTVSITGGEVELTAVVSGSGGDKAIFAGTLTIGENMQILAGSSAADAAVVGSYNDEMYVKITPKPKDLIITGGTEGTDYTYENGVLDIKAAGTYEIKNVVPATATGDIIKVSAPSGTVNITLSGVVINVSATDLAAFEITGECTTKLILKDGSKNSLDSGVDRAGIANHSHNLIITCENAENATHICSSDCGVLRAIGQYYGAGIGGDSDESGSNIIITGGNIVADIVNSQGGAGIGGGLGGNGSNITISGGTVTATGGGAGIGGGNSGNGSNITISGGTVTATSTGNGAGIGGGFNGSGNNITISGGTVTATSVHGAGIGGGRFGIGDSITISGGTVTATSVHGAGIGGGANGGIAENIKIAPAANTRIYAYNGSDNTGTALTGSPFTTETDITGRLRGNAFYSYAEHVHNYTYTSSDNIITETCTCGHSETASITAPQNLVYDGTAKAASVAYSADWQGGNLIVTYSAGGNINAGTVTASIEKGGAKASVDYDITKVNPTYTVPTGLTATYGQTLASVVLPEGWIWDDPAASVGNAGTSRFKAIFTPADTTNYNTVSADVEVAVGKAVITITVDNKTAKQYEDLPAFTFTVTGLIQGDALITNPIISTGADMKSAGEFEIVATGANAGGNYTITYVPGKLTVEAHTEHTGGTATCTEKAICSVCAQPYGATLGHDWGNWISDGNGTHSRTCATDANYTETDDCSGGTATCTEKAKCSVCGTTYGNLAEHTYGTEWKFDGSNHWHECTCGAKSDEATHNGGTATCKDKAVCSTCDTAYGELAAHNYKDGKCTVCEATDPNYVPETDSPQTGDNSHMALWIALLFISGGAVITLTIVDRKRRVASKR